MGAIALSGHVRGLDAGVVCVRVAVVDYYSACTVLQCSVMDDSPFLWEHAIFVPPPHQHSWTEYTKSSDRKVIWSPFIYLFI
jgi:hypothetical protein